MFLENLKILKENKNVRGKKQKLKLSFFWVFKGYKDKIVLPCLKFIPIVCNLI